MKSKAKRTKARPPWRNLTHKRAAGDDHALMRQEMRQMIEKQSDMHVIGEAQDGECAIELAHKLCPDVVLVDVNMPRIGGIEAMSRIKASMPRIRIIGLSVYSEQAVAQAMRKAGADDYITKETAARALCTAIRSAKNKQLR